MLVQSFRYDSQKEGDLVNRTRNGHEVPVEKLLGRVVMHWANQLMAGEIKFERRRPIEVMLQVS